MRSSLEGSDGVMAIASLVFEFHAEINA
jgi:hypothetical protein